MYIPTKGNELVFNMEKYIETYLPEQSYKNLKERVCASKIEFFCVLREFICKRARVYDYSVTGIGYTLIDSMYDLDQDNPTVGDWFVIKSINRYGITVYFRIVFQSSEYISVIGYRYWDTTDHIGTDGFYNEGAHIPLAESSTLWIYGDLSSLAILVVTNTVPSLFLLGTTKDSLYSQRSAKSLSPLSAGSNVSIITDDKVDTFVDDAVFVFDDLNIELLTVTSKNDYVKEIKGNLVNSYPTGAQIVPDLCIFVQASNDLSNINNFKGLIGNTGGKNVTLNWDIFDSLLDQHDPSPLNSDYVTSYISLSGSGFQGYIRNIQVAGFGLNLADGTIFNDRYDNWRLFTVNGYKLLFREV